MKEPKMKTQLTCPRCKYFVIGRPEYVFCPLCSIKLTRKVLTDIGVEKNDM